MIVKTAVKYLLLSVAFMFLSSGVLVAGFLDVYDSVGCSIFGLLIPMTSLFIAAVLVNDRILIPRLLLRNRLGRYCISVFGIVYMLTLLSLALEYATRRLLDLPMRINDYSSPWILADASGNGILLAIILLGLGMWHLFNHWQREMRMEINMTARLQAYLSAVRHRLNPSLILGKLNAIRSNLEADPETIETRIRELSVYLREQLYELPDPPAIESPAIDNHGESRITALLVSKRWHCARHMIFAGILMFISCGAFFNAPDEPEFTAGRLSGVFAMFAVLAAIAYINILWLYPRFMKRGNIRRYAVSVSALLIAIVVPLILVQLQTYEPNVYAKRLPVMISIISTIGSLMTLFLFICGISAALLLQNWIGTRQRLTRLHAETIRQEYVYLRKQINPHFLFNVLNNIGITVYDDPVYARSLIDDLFSLLKYQLVKYQLEDVRRDTTTLSHEISFVRNYFALEATRKDTFDYVIDTDVADMEVGIPTLLFIPFIENAVKYSVSGSGMPEVRISFSIIGDVLTFTCINPYDAEEVENIQGGGIGIENTRRRLELLYESDYTLQCDKTDNKYSVKLVIPLR